MTSLHASTLFRNAPAVKPRLPRNVPSSLDLVGCHFQGDDHEAHAW
jgi:hypothetical protein